MGSHCRTEIQQIIESLVFLFGIISSVFRV